jgi:hypothetical protein
MARSPAVESSGKCVEEHPQDRVQDPSQNDSSKASASITWTFRHRFFFDASSRVYANLGADLDTDHLTRLADGVNEVRKAAARSATHIENTIALFQIQQFDCL